MPVNAASDPRTPADRGRAPGLSRKRGVGLIQRHQRVEIAGVDSVNDSFEHLLRRLPAGSCSIPRQVRLCGHGCLLLRLFGVDVRKCHDSEQCYRGDKGGTRDSGFGSRGSGSGFGTRDEPAAPKLAELYGAKAGDQGLGWRPNSRSSMSEGGRAHHSFSRNFLISRTRNFWNSHR